jgi:glycosyltransferase involved in cell wall biosynthesis
MRIALIIPGGVDPSGRERVIPALLSLIKRLARRHQVLVASLAPATPGSYQLFGAHIVGLRKVFSPIPGVAGLRRWQQLMAGVDWLGGRPDVVHAFGVGGTSTLALLLGRRFRAPVVISLLGGELVYVPQIGYGGLRGPRGRVQAYLAKRWAAALTAGSRYSLAPLVKLRPDAHWLPLGAEAPLRAGTVTRPPGPPWRLLHVASINRVKDQATLLRALRVAIDRSNAKSAGVGLWQLDWVGEDTLHSSMQHLAAALGLSEVVRFHGFQPLDLIYPLYGQAHLFLQSSLHESQGVAVCEAAAAGVPTVGTNVGLVAELTPEAALAVPVGDHEAMAAGILALLGDQARREQLGQAAQAWAAKYDAAWTAGAFETIYASLYRKN